MIRGEGKTGTNLQVVDDLGKHVASHSPFVECSLIGFEHTLHFFGVALSFCGDLSGGGILSCEGMKKFGNQL